MSLTLSSVVSTKWSTRSMRWWRSCGRDLVGYGGMSCMGGYGELAVALLVGEGCERRREATGMRKTEQKSRFLLSFHAQATPWQPTCAQEQPHGA
jgi:hypothetical protein